MKITAKPDASLSAILDAEARHIADTAADAVDKAATSIRDELRAQTRSALGPKLERAWTFRRYHKAGGKIDETALIYSKASRIVSAFSDDTTITVRNAQWLVLPLDAAKAAGFDKRQNRHWSAVDAATKALGKLDFVPLPGNRALLVHRQRSGKPVPFFLLVKRVSLRKRLDIAGPAARSGDVFARNFIGAI